MNFIFQEEKIEELLYIVYKEFSMDGMLSDIMEEFKKRDIVFDSDRQMETICSDHDGSK